MDKKIEHKIWLKLDKIVFQPQYKNLDKGGMRSKIMSELLTFIQSLLQSEREKQHTKDIEEFREMITAKPLDYPVNDFIKELLSEFNKLEVKKEK